MYRKIPSIQVVGYQSVETVFGNQGKGVTFIPVQGEGKLGDLVIVGYNKEDGYDGGQISCGKLDIYGRSTARYYWMDVAAFEDEGEIWGPWYGWYDLDGENCFNDVPLAAGEGVWLASPSSDYSVQSAGEVAQSSIAVNMVFGNLLCSNPMPCTTYLRDVWVSGYDPADGYDGGQISCGKLDIYGRSIARYYWMDVEAFEDEGETWGPWYGWYDLDGENCFNDIPVNAGEALWVASPSDAFNLNWKSPLAK